MKKAILLFISLLLAISLHAQDTIHQDEIRYTIANLNLREAPNTASYVITQIPKGTPVTIDKDCDCKWIPIKYAGYIGYVSTQYLSKEKVEYFPSHYSGAIKHYTNSEGEKSSITYSI